MTWSEMKERAHTLAARMTTTLARMREHAKLTPQWAAALVHYEKSVEHFRLGLKVLSMRDDWTADDVSGHEPALQSYEGATAVLESALDIADGMEAAN